MRPIERFYPESKFGGFTDIDGTLVFYQRVNALVGPESVVLDAGCGRGEFHESAAPLVRGMRTLRGKVSRVIGIDVDPAGADNPGIDEFRMIRGDRWPVEDRSVDMVVLDYVVEHLERPADVLREAARVLRKGGYIAIRTTNRWSYVALAARLIPNRYHARVTATVQGARQERDVFPTVYRCNTIYAVRGHLRDAGFDSVVYGYEPEPGYLSFSRIAYFGGVLHQKFAPGAVRPALFAFGRLADVD